MLSWLMRVFNKSAILHYARRHAGAREDLLAWHAETEKAVWGSPSEIKRQFPNASVVANNRVVFNICGNRYRLIVSFAYRHQACYVKFFGSHAEYDRVDAATVDHTGVIHGKANR